MNLLVVNANLSHYLYVGCSIRSRFQPERTRWLCLFRLLNYPRLRTQSFSQKAPGAGPAEFLIENHLCRYYQNGLRSDALNISIATATESPKNPKNPTVAATIWSMVFPSDSVSISMRKQMSVAKRFRNNAVFMSSISNFRL